MLSSKQSEISPVEILPRSQSSTSSTTTTTTSNNSSRNNWIAKENAALNDVKQVTSSSHNDVHKEDDEDELPVLSKWKHANDDTKARVRDQTTSDLLQYVQILEQEKRDFAKQLHALKEKDASNQIQLATAIRRIGILETSLETALRDKETLQQAQQQAETRHKDEKDQYTVLMEENKELKRKLDDTERARHYAVFRLSELQAEQAQNDLDASPKELSDASHAAQPSSSSSSLHQPPNEGIEQMKREMELWRQRAALQVEQLKEKHQVAMDLAVRKAQLDQATLVDKMQLETELRLSEWRHEEALRAREIESAMEEDRYSIRLEMKHGMQRAQIEHQVWSLRSQVMSDASGVVGGSGGNTGVLNSFTAEYSAGTLDEVLVRMQMELVRRRRFDALRKMLLVRNFHRTKALQESIYRWQHVVSQVKLARLNAVLHMVRIDHHLQHAQLKKSFAKWKFQSQLVKSEAFQRNSMHCWNRMLAVERINHVLQQQMIKRAALLFFKWKQGTSSSGSEAKTIPLHQEIKKLHEQLALSKAEAWRYKRQLLKQFL